MNPPRVVRLNRMILGVASPLADFSRAYFGVDVIDVDGVDECAGADVVVLGRQQLRDDGHRLAVDLMAPLLRVVRPSLLIATLPDTYEQNRYARDLVAWRQACAQGVPTLVLEMRALRALREQGHDDASVVERARAHEATARQLLTPVSWLGGASLS